MTNNGVKFANMSNECLQLFSETKKAFLKSEKDEIKRMALSVPSCFIDENKSLNIVFAGQYGAGKSSIISILTGEKLEIGQGITTQQIQSFLWNGITITDTPGVHTQKRPDHDEITYQAIANADLVVFVVTNEGFSEHLGQHFRKLLIDKGKGKEMMLVVNKMESTALGNTEEQQKIYIEKNLVPVISPDFSPEDLYVSFVDAKAYEDAMKTSDSDEKKWLLGVSGFGKLIENLNKFSKDKNFIGKCTTSLYQNEQLIREAMAEFGTGDFCIDGTMNVLSKQRRILSESKENIKNSSYNLVRRHTQKIIQWGDEIANGLSSKDKERDVNNRLQECYNNVNDIPISVAKEFEVIVSKENERLKNQIQDLENTSFVRDFKTIVEEKYSDIKADPTRSRGTQKGAKRISDFGVWLSKQSTGPNAGSGWASIFKLGTYSGSKTHSVVLEVGHLVGHKFKPWEAVKIAGKIGKVGKFLGVAGSFVGIIAQISSDRQEVKMERQLSDTRSDIRNSFNSAADAINMKFDEETQTWVEENYDTKIAEIDQSFEELKSLAETKQSELENYQVLFDRNRELIKKMHDFVNQ